MRRLPLLVLAALTVCVIAGSAPARPPAGDHTITTTHFVVHYHTDVDPTTGAPALDYSTQTDAGDIAGYAEAAYALYKSWGYTTPVDDGDGHVDIWINDLSTQGVRSVAAWDNVSGPGPSSGWFEIATPTQLQVFAPGDGMTLAQEEQQVVADNVFYMFGFANWVPTSGSDEWLLYGAAEWASQVETNYTPTGAVGDPDIAVDCHDNLAAHQMCDPHFYVDSGAARWAFFQQLASEYGNAFVGNAFANAGLGQTATTALSNAIAAKSSTLTSQFNTYAANLMDGNVGVASLASFRPSADATVTTGVKTATLPPVNVTPVNHLAARYVTFQRGDGDGSHACFAATLSINVAIPSGTSAQPYFFWDAPGSIAQALTVSGSTATITVPWDTCNWGSARGWLSIPNAGTTVDAADFTVTSSIAVDTTTAATAAPPPTPSSIWGTTVPVPTTDVAPSIEVNGPELIKLDSKAATIRLIVDSSGPGSVSAALGSTALGAAALRSGNNDLRFSVPKGLLTTLRRTASATNVLTLTPMSPSGSVTGTAVTRQVLVTTTKPKARKKK